MTPENLRLIWLCSLSGKAGPKGVSEGLWAGHGGLKTFDLGQTLDKKKSKELSKDTKITVLNYKNPWTPWYKIKSSLVRVRKKVKDQKFESSCSLKKSKFVSSRVRVHLEKSKIISSKVRPWKNCKSSWVLEFTFSEKLEVQKIISSLVRELLIFTRTFDLFDAHPWIMFMWGMNNIV